MPTPKEQIKWAQILAMEKQQAKTAQKKTPEIETNEIHEEMDHITEQIYKAAIAQNYELARELVDKMVKLRARLSIMRLENWERKFVAPNKQIIDSEMVTYAKDCLEIAAHVDALFEQSPTP